MISLSYFALCLFSTVLMANHCSAEDSEEIKVKILGSEGVSPRILLGVQHVIKEALLKYHHPDTHGPAPESIKVSILEIKDFSDDMTLNAVGVLTRAVQYYSDNPCNHLRKYFLEHYSDFDWQCVDYNMYSVGRWKSINMEVGNKRYLLFATTRQLVKEGE